MVAETLAQGVEDAPRGGKEVVGPEFHVGDPEPQAEETEIKKGPLKLWIHPFSSSERAFSTSECRPSTISRISCTSFGSSGSRGLATSTLKIFLMRPGRKVNSATRSPR